MTERKDRLDGLAIAVLLACCLFWGFQQSLIKTTVGEIPPLWQAGLRFAGAAVLLWLWCRARGVPLFGRDGTLWAGLLAGVLFMGEFSCVYLGLRDAPASRFTVFFYTAPFVIALLMPYIEPAERLRGWQWGGLAIAFAAVALAFSEGFSHSTARQLRGDALALAASALWGLTTLVIRGSRLITISAEKALFYQVGVSAIAAPCVSLALGEPWSLHYSAAAWGSLALQAAVGAFASYLAWMWMLRRYPATRLSSFTFITPLAALVFGVVLFGEPLTVRLVLALTGVALGVVLVNRK